jgi:hypothetical protein
MIICYLDEEPINKYCLVTLLDQHDTKIMTFLEVIGTLSLGLSLFFGVFTLSILVSQILLIKDNTSTIDNLHGKNKHKEA